MVVFSKSKIIIRIINKNKCGIFYTSRGGRGSDQVIFHTFVRRGREGDVKLGPVCFMYADKFPKIHQVLKI